MPDNDVERASALAEQATHASVTAERLIENRIGFQRYRLSQEPLYRRLKQGEQPHFLFHADKEVPKFNGPAAPDGIRSSLRHRVMHLVTGQRWLMIAGHRDGDQEREIALGAIGATNFETDGRLPTALSNNLFVFEIEGAHITVPLANEYDADDLEDLSRYLRDEVGATRGGVAVDSDEAGYTVAGQDAIEYDARDVRNRLDQLPADVREEASTHVRTADSAEELIPYLDDLIADHEEPGRTLDEVIGEATSVEELRRELQRRLKTHVAELKTVSDRVSTRSARPYRTPIPKRPGGMRSALAGRRIRLPVAHPPPRSRFWWEPSRPVRRQGSTRAVVRTPPWPNWTPRRWPLT